MFFGLNMSLLFFASFFFELSKKINPIRIQSFIQFVLLMFFFGALVSVFDSNTSNGLNKGFAVLPNYLYWTLLCILLINIYKNIELYFVVPYVFIGLLISSFYFYIFPSLPKIPGFLNPVTANSYSFLAICFTAPCSVYLLKKKGKIVAYLFILSILFILLSNGRRAGFSIVLGTTFFAINLKSFKIKYILNVFILMVILKFFLGLNITNSIIMKSSPRIHQLVYSNNDLFEEDRSLLVRKLMVEKAMIIFEEHPFTGIGLNSFSSYKVDFRGDFTGSEFVINKSDSNSKSAHNSYVSLLSEGGLLLLIPFLIILFFNIYNFIKYYNHRTHIENSFYWSFLGMCVHLYFISAIINVYAWFLIGIVSAISANSKIMLLTNKQFLSNR